MVTSGYGEVGKEDFFNVSVSRVRLADICKSCSGSGRGCIAGCSCGCTMLDDG